MASLFQRRRSKATQTERVRERKHEGFLRYAGFRWAKISGGLCLLIIISYALVDVTPRHNGGSWYGYTLGTIGAGLILWLTALGYRKRKMTSDYWSLKAWTSAHVYLGLSLIVIGTWHTGFQLGWNVHTLAWALMMLVILSGLYGVIVYATLPAALSNNRDEMTQMQMLEAIRAFDRQLHSAAQPLTPADTAPVLAALDENPFAGGIGARLSGRYPNCATAAALRTLSGSNGSDREAREKVVGLLKQKEAALTRLRRHLKIRALLEIWLYVHVPLTFALIAALSAHIISVFFYW
ncbi:hypothetical protein ATE68_10250 [Sphingopyxis sp. H038]|uniref:hypothetical protein n=1 Tax=unclassified Sphingopyxis TaxID=2614943 RepID=UPI000731C7B9|nr:MULTISPECIES: hypothetical protein [unclassified Sphingopyxis]KTE01195.1 hypothetical protein ATE78_15935 [Sphingopyxis sp. H012]KTE04994.1 hypothetical protein ATE76_22445 [Sphingopyxis sp. H093]KTE12545.1 hypothetical protein ATE70_04560 [Sphingopyxis sp. H053]KTE26792.1 hypothetical protein ATE75_14805 [Sphingopyxis sp. H080]KTE34735.1 hypothetical protein ATE68_10250 [Sphingopyxis sp. H038]